MSAPYFSIMKLQILVTQYKETDEVVKPLLDSIAIQQNVDFGEIGVIICNDGSDVHLSKELMDSYSFHIQYWQNEHKGVSATRNALLDLATAEYVMFCDADDMFLSVCALHTIFLSIEKGFDSLNSAFVEEAIYTNTGEPVYVTHETDSTFIHGKVHRRQYLIDKNIRWNEDLTIHEDSFFNVLCQSLSDNVVYVSTPFYLWKYRADSVCRNDKKFMMKTYDKLLDSNAALIDEFVKRGIIDKAMYFFSYMVFETYYTMNKPNWLSDTNAKYREKTEKRFAEYFMKRKDLWDNIEMWDKVKVSDQARQKVIGEGMILEAVTIFEWLYKVTGEKQCLQEK